MALRRGAISLSAAVVGLMAALPIHADPALAESPSRNLSPEQRRSLVTTLAPTGLRPAAPADLPAGFRVTVAEADASGRYANGDFDPGLRIDYRGPDNQCFQLMETKGGSRGLQKLTSVNSAIGTIAIYRDPAPSGLNSSHRLVAFLPDGGLVLHTPAAAEESADGRFQTCHPIPQQAFQKVVGSLRWLEP